MPERVSIRAVRRPPAVLAPALAMLLGVLAAGATTAQAQQVRAGGRLVPIEPTLVGYNVSTWRNGPDWRDEAMRGTVRALAPGNLRYPGGTVSNYWDWRTGTVIETIDSGSFRHVASRARLRPADLVAGKPADARIVYVANLARPTPITGVSIEEAARAPGSLEILDAKIDDMLDALEAFRRAGHRVRHVELGNEFYHGADGGVDGQGGIYTGRPGLYVKHAQRVVQALRGHDPAIEIAVVGQAARGGKRVSDWNRVLYAALRDGRLSDIDAITFHWYSGPGVSGTPAGPEAAEQSLAQAHGFVDRAITGDLANLPAGLDVWVTEYNTFSQPTAELGSGEIDGGPIQGSWTNGLFAAILTLRLAALDERVNLLDVHAIAIGGNRQWNMLEDAATLSGNGLAMGAVGRAFGGRRELRELVFEGLGTAETRRGTPTVYGLRLSGGGGESLVIINATRRAVTGLDVGPALFRGGHYLIEQHHDATPLNAPVKAGRGGGIASRRGDFTGRLIDLPPFSLSVIRSARD